MQRIEVAGHRLRVERRGSGPPSFLCLHGLVDTLEIWDRLVDPLAALGEVVRYDQRAHGESDAPPGEYAREDLAGDAVAVLDQLGIERAVLIGHSMGGIVAMTTALAHPDRVAGLVLIGTASQCSERVAGFYDRIAAAGESEGNEGLARVIYGRDTDRRVRGDAGGIARVTRTLKSLYTDPLTPKLAGLACPVLLLVGERDPMGPRASEIILDHLPSATLRVVPEQGHWLHVDVPDVVMDSLGHWWMGHNPT